MKTISVKKCIYCPFFDEDVSGFNHRAGCWLDVDVIPKRDTPPFACPLRAEGILVQFVEDDNQ